MPSTSGLGANGQATTMRDCALHRRANPVRSIRPQGDQRRALSGTQPQTGCFPISTGREVVGLLDLQTAGVMAASPVGEAQDLPTAPVLKR